MSLFKAPLTTMVESINLLNSKSLVASEYNFGTPTAIDPVAGRNASVVVSAKSTASAYAGSVTFTYHRRDLIELADQVNLVVAVNNPTSTQDIIDAMNKAFGMVLDGNEIVIRPLTTDEKVPGNPIAIEATAGAYAWVGGVNVTWRTGGYKLSDYLKTVNLPGLNYPAPTTTRPYAQFYSYPRDFSAQHVKLSTVQVGAGQLQAVSEVLTAVTGDTWVLSGSARYSLDGAVVMATGLTSSSPDDTNSAKYTHFIQVQVDAVKCLGLAGLLTLHFNLPDA